MDHYNTKTLLQEDFFPSISNDGHVYETTGVGRASKTNRKYKTHDSDSNFMSTRFQGFLNSHFPQGHIHYTTAPEIRAMKHRPKGQTTLTFEASSKEMPRGKDNVIKAAQEFEVPGGTKVLLILPEIQYRDILGKYERYRCGKKSKGIKTPCPWCSSNDHVEYTNFTGRKPDSIRVI